MQPLLNIALLTFLILGCCAPALAQKQEQHSHSQSSAVILAYHRIDEDLYPTTNLSEEDFKAQIQELLSEDYNIKPLETIVAAFRNNRQLPPKTIAITFEGAYGSAFKRAMPYLLEYNIPFTIFFASDMAARSSVEYMSWKDLLSLRHNAKVSFGILPASYVHLYENTDEENKRLFHKAKKEFRERFGYEATLFSYPYGEYDKNYIEFIENQNITTALSLNSGVASHHSDIYALPRFSMTEGYGDLNRFRLVANAMPFDIDDLEPRYSLFQQQEELLIGFSIKNEDTSLLKKTNCFLSGQGRINFEIVGQRRVEIRAKNKFHEQRLRLNCTAPGKTENGEITSWRWLGFLFSFAE